MASFKSNDLVSGVVWGTVINVLINAVLPQLGKIDLSALGAPSIAAPAPAPTPADEEEPAEEPLEDDMEEEEPMDGEGDGEEEDGTMGTDDTYFDDEEPVEGGGIQLSPDERRRISSYGNVARYVRAMHAGRMVNIN